MRTTFFCSFSFLLQPEGKDETLSVSVKSNNDADEDVVVWALTWQMGEAQWVEGRVFIEESHQEKQYSVVIATKKGSNDQRNKLVFRYWHIHFITLATQLELISILDLLK